MSLVDASRTSRELVRELRGVPNSVPPTSGTPEVFDGPTLPESVAWQTFLELRKRGEPDATRLFLTAVRSLHSRRCIAGTQLPTGDAQPDEHRLTDDAFLADLWKAYKKCITTHRTGPASQLLRDLEEHLS